MLEVRNFEADDEEEVIELWNSCLTRDPINYARFYERIILDPNFDKNMCLVADKDNEIVGFIYGIVRKFPYEERGLEPDRGWIPIIFVRKDSRRKGIGTKLVSEIERKILSLNRKNITLAAYSPNYFFPGLDKEVYKESIEFFQDLGYGLTGEAVAMDKVLYDFVIPENIMEIEKELNKEGYTIKNFTRKYTIPLIDFLKTSFEGGWVRNARQALLEGKGEENLIIALDADDKVVGYCQRAIDGLEGHFGPFGVSEKLRGKRLGTILFYKMLHDMYTKGIYHTWLAWTDGSAQRFYERAGMRVNRKYALMRKNL